MRVLIINKFLYPNGGSETYIFKLGEALEQHGHEVQYFGMEHEGRCVGNRVNAYTSGMDFHGGSKLSKLTYPIKTIYSKEARVQLRKVLDDFKPDVCHLNNFNYQLTPSIILEIVKWRKETGRDCKIIFTAHDYQLVCPNHMLNNPNTHQNCEKCLGGHFVNCMKGKCIHGSTAKSAIGMMEAEFWKWKGTYKYIDTMICCSEFMKSKMDSNPQFATKTVAMHNFIDKVEWKETPKKDYVLYFGRFSEEKGIGTLIKVCKELPDVQFIFAGTGPLEETVNGIKNMDKLMVGQMSSMSQLGLYENAEKLTGIPTSLITSLGIVLLPRITNLLSTGDKKKADEIFNISFLYVMFLGSGLVFGLLGVSEAFVPVFFGEEFIELTTFLPYLAPSILFLCLVTNIRSQILLPNKLDKQYLYSTIVGASINLGLNFMLIPSQGALGASAATLVAYIALFLFQGMCARKYTDLIGNSIINIPFVLIGFLMYLLIRNISFGNGIMTVIVRVIIGGFVYLAGSIVFVFIFRKRELNSFASYFNLTRGDKK